MLWEDYNMSKLNVDQKTIKDLFQDKKADFLIPDYQRPYAWGETECQTLWDDIFSFAIPDEGRVEFDSNSEYFLGPIVTFRNTNFKMEVIDGQQRLTTLMLLLRAFYTKFDCCHVHTLFQFYIPLEPLYLPSQFFQLRVHFHPPVKLLLFPHLAFQCGNLLFKLLLLFIPLNRFFQALAGICLQLVPGNLTDKAFIDGIHIQAVDAEMQFVFRHPVGMIIAAHLKGVAAGCGSLLVADPRLSLAVTGQNKENVVRDLLVDLL